MIQLWIAPVLEKTLQHHRDKEWGWHADTKMLLGGIDAALSSCFHSGIALSYASNHVQWEKAKGRGTVDGAFGGLYHNWLSKIAYINGIFTGGYNKISAARTMHFSIFDKTAKYDQHNWFLQANGEIGLLPRVGIVQFRPFGNVNYVYLHEKKFKETGADGLNLVVDAVDSNFLRIEAGINLSTCIQIKSFQWIPEIQCSWVKEKRQDGKSFKARFRESNVDFTVEGEYPSRHLLATGGGLTVRSLNSSIAFSVYYDLQIAKRSSLN